MNGELNNNLHDAAMLKPIQQKVQNPVHIKKKKTKTWKGKQNKAKFNT